MKPNIAVATALVGATAIIACGWGLHSCQQQFWERTLHGPFAGAPYTTGIITAPVSVLRMPPGGQLEVHGSPASSNAGSFFARPLMVFNGHAFSFPKGSFTMVPLKLRGYVSYDSIECNNEAAAGLCSYHAIGVGEVAKEASSTSILPGIFKNLLYPGRGGVSWSKTNARPFPENQRKGHKAQRREENCSRWSHGFLILSVFATCPPR